MKRKIKNELVALSVARVIRNISIAVSLVILAASFMLIEIISK
jgi:hypothetical protein